MALAQPRLSVCQERGDMRDRGSHNPSGSFADLTKKPVEQDEDRTGEGWDIQVVGA